MAVTSPETRINQPENRNHEYIKSISVNGVVYPLINGLNAIIGENGSGKSTLLKIMNDQISEKYVTELKRENNIICENNYKDKCLFLKQGEIVNLFDSHNLFPVANFSSVDHSKFRRMYTEFANGLLNYIQKKIKAKETRENLTKECLSYNELIHEKSYFVQIDVADDYSEIDNPHQKHDTELKNIISSLDQLKEDTYYERFETDLNTIYELFSKIYSQVHSDNAAANAERLVKNQIISCIKSYDLKISGSATSQENEKREYLDYRRNFIDCIKKAIRTNAEEMVFPNLPYRVNGFSTNPKNGFSFNLEAFYHGKDVLDVFLIRMFTGNYTTIDALKKIDTNEELVKAVYGCTALSQLNMIFQRNLTKFLDEMCDETRYIVDLTKGNETLGNTLGELSLAYFKYMTENENQKCIFLIDQPEDHISNNNVSENLLRYFNFIRYKKQVIMVTHNPLLVVNQDVDQIIFVSKNKNRMDIVSGCLEYEDNNTNILDIIAKNMDGGRASIEKRLKVYGKNH